MIQLIIMIWVLVIVVSRLQKSGKPNEQKQPNVHSQPNVQNRSTVYKETPEELKRRLLEKYAGQTKVQPVKEKDILARASANVAEDFTEKTMERKESVQTMSEAPGMTRKQIVEEADALAEVDLQQIYDVPEAVQESELMKRVSDIMAKGVDTELTFERDFVAEALDMISEITV